MQYLNLFLIVFVNGLWFLRPSTGCRHQLTRKCHWVSPNFQRQSSTAKRSETTTKHQQHEVNSIAGHHGPYIWVPWDLSKILSRRISSRPQPDWGQSIPPGVPALATMPARRRPRRLQYPPPGRKTSPQRPVPLAVSPPQFPSVRSLARFPGSIRSG